MPYLLVYPASYFYPGICRSTSRRSTESSWSSGSLLQCYRDRPLRGPASHGQPGGTAVRGSVDDRGLIQAPTWTLAVASGLWGSDSSRRSSRTRMSTSSRRVRRDRALGAVLRSAGARQRRGSRRRVEPRRAWAGASGARAGGRRPDAGGRALVARPAGVSRAAGRTAPAAAWRGATRDVHRRAAGGRGPRARPRRPARAARGGRLGRTARARERAPAGRAPGAARRATRLAGPHHPRRRRGTPPTRARPPRRRATTARSRWGWACSCSTATSTRPPKSSSRRARTSSSRPCRNSASSRTGSTPRHSPTTASAHRPYSRSARTRPRHGRDRRAHGPPPERRNSRLLRRRRGTREHREVRRGPRGIGHRRSQERQRAHRDPRRRTRRRHPDQGTGLKGLADRVGALVGELTIESPGQHGTRIIAQIPCAS